MIHKPSFADNEVDDHDEDHQNFREAMEAVIACGNQLLKTNDQHTNPWDMASGLLSGAVHFWLFSRQPCASPACEPCSSMNTADRRMAQLIKEVSERGEASEYFHSPNDHNVGSA